MKTIIKFSMLFLLTFAAFIDPLTAQDATKELSEFTKTFEEAYNKKDDKALKEMFTTEAVRTNIDGTVIKGNEAIRALYADGFKGNISIVLKPETAVTAAGGGTTATGVYHVTGTSAKGEKVDRKGKYVNTVVKENGQWKISESVLTAL